MTDRIEKQIEIAAPVARVWKALTDYRQFSEWFQLKLDGPFEAGKPQGGQLTFPGYEHIRMDVMVKTIDAETYFAYTWHPFAMDPNVDYSQETPTLVEFRLQATEAGGTQLTVTESGFDKIPAERRAQALRSNEGGWEQQLKSLQKYVGKSA